MALPKQIKIGHHKLKVSVVDGLLNSKGEKLWGHYRSDSHEITLDREMVGTTREKEIIIHELLHAISDFYHLWKREDDEQKEEIVVSNLASGLTMVLNDNKKLREYLCSS